MFVYFLFRLRPPLPMYWSEWALFLQLLRWPSNVSFFFTLLLFLLNSEKPPFVKVFEIPMLRVIRELRLAKAPCSSTLSFFSCMLPTFFFSFFFWWLPSRENWFFANYGMLESFVCLCFDTSDPRSTIRRRSLPFLYQFFSACCTHLLFLCFPLQFFKIVFFFLWVLVFPF